MLLASFFFKVNKNEKSEKEKKTSKKNYLKNR